MKHKLPESATVTVEWGSVNFTGELIYCQPHREEFLVGLKVEDPVYETARKYASNPS